MAPRPLASGDERDAILRAAIQLFARRGFFHAQVADVARAAGVVAGTVYLYFRNKDDLLTSIFEQAMSEAIAEGRSALDGVADPIERLRRIAHLHLTSSVSGEIANSPSCSRSSCGKSTKFMEHFSSTLLRQYLGVIREAVAKAQAGDVFRRDVNPTLAAKVFFGALDEMATNWVLSGRQYALVADADVVVDLFVNGVRAARA